MKEILTDEMTRAGESAWQDQVLEHGAGRPVEMVAAVYLAMAALSPEIKAITAAVAAEREATGELIIKIMNEETDNQKRNDEWAAGFKLACRMIGAGNRARGKQDAREATCKESLQVQTESGRDVPAGIIKAAQKVRQAAHSHALHNFPQKRALDTDGGIARRRAKDALDQAITELCNAVDAAPTPRGKQ